MMAPAALRSVMSAENAEDTSLALPSDNKLRMGQQRVLDQVHTIKRGKAKPSVSPSSTPTGVFPQSVSVFEEVGSFRFSPTKTNGVFRRSHSTGLSKVAHVQKSRTMSSRTLRGRYGSTHVPSSNPPDALIGMQSSRSDPSLAPAPALSAAVASAPNMRGKGMTVQSQVSRHSSYSLSNGILMGSGQTRAVRPPSVHSVTDSKVTATKTAKTDQQTLVNNVVTTSDLTLKEAVEFLSCPEESFQQCGATFIQHATYKEEQAKQEVSSLGGIPYLVTLLRSPNPLVSQSASGALRNLVFKDHNNKMEVQQFDGIAKALQLLKETDSTETQKQITGLLWNLSSADELKEELISAGLPVLTENVVVPFTCWSDSSANNNIHPDVFFSATGCLRNLSCGQQKERQAMRDCRGLIDSIMSYVQSCVAEDNPDDKSVENCVCILHNLTYQLESEAPQCFAKYNPSTANSSESKKKQTIGCFSPKSSKAQKEFAIDAIPETPEDNAPSGLKWLCHTKAMQTYLSLVGSSQNDATLEACCGALQNLTASKGPGSSAMSHILVQKLLALQHLSPLLNSPKRRVQKTAISLLGNLSRTSSLHASMAKQVLAQLCSLLSGSPRDMGNSDDNISTTCNTSRSLMLADTEVSKKLLSNELVSALADLSENSTYPKGCKAASYLLYSMWNDKTLQGTLKKLKLDKATFVNENTTAVHKSLQVIE